MKIILYILITLCLTINSLSFSGKGKGTQDDPYQITNAYQLQEIQLAIYANYKLMNDIDAKETHSWDVGDHDKDSTTPNAPMGFKPINFGGSLNGDGYIIVNLYINRPLDSRVALFKIIGGDVKRLGIVDCDIIGCDNVSSLCGLCADGTISECYSTGFITAKCNSGYNSGFCGMLGGGSIENCYSSCTISAISDTTDYSAASFCASQPIGISITFCYSVGKVICNKKVSVFGKNEIASNSFWDIETTSIPDSGGHYAKGLSTSDMMKRHTFEEVG